MDEPIVRRLAVAVLTYDRPELLRSTLLDLCASDVPVGWCRDVLIVDNSESLAGKLAADDALEHGLADACRHMVYNVGIAAGWNQAWQYVNDVGVNGFFEGPPDVVALIQDDVKLDPDWFSECLAALDYWPDLAVVSGYNSPKHETLERRAHGNLRLYTKVALPGVHLVAKRAFWEGVFPIVSVEHHTGEDWWFTKYSPGAPCNIGKVCGVVPGLVRHVGVESTWNPTPHPEYVDPVAEAL